MIPIERAGRHCSLVFALTLAMATGDAEAVTFSVPLSTEGAAFVDGGRTTLPDLDVMALAPLSFQIEPIDILFFASGETASLRVVVTFRDWHKEAHGTKVWVEKAL